MCVNYKLYTEKINRYVTMGSNTDAVQKVLETLEKGMNERVKKSISVMIEAVNESLYKIMKSIYETEEMLDLSLRKDILSASLAIDGCSEKSSAIIKDDYDNTSYETKAKKTKNKLMEAKISHASFPLIDYSKTQFKAKEEINFQHYENYEDDTENKSKSQDPLERELETTDKRSRNSKKVYDNLSSFGEEECDRYSDSDFLSTPRGFDSKVQEAFVTTGREYERNPKVEARLEKRKRKEEERRSKKKTPEELSEIRKRAGRNGGLARSRKMSKVERVAAARAGGLARVQKIELMA